MATQMGFDNGSGYEPIWSEMKKDPKTGYWGQTVTGYKKRESTQDNFLSAYEKELQNRSAMRDLDAKYGFASSNSGNNSSSTANIGGIGGIDDITKQAKDLAQFRLGLDFQQMDKSAGLRESESKNNFGRTTKLTDQTFDWQRKINTDTQDAQTKRNLDTIGGQKDILNTGINQENFAARRAIGLASRRLGG